jgi:hypothetical protein
MDGHRGLLAFTQQHVGECMLSELDGGVRTLCVADPVVPRDRRQGREVHD